MVEFEVKRKKKQKKKTFFYLQGIQYLFKSKVNSIPVLNQLYLLLFFGKQRTSIYNFGAISFEVESLFFASIPLYKGQSLYYVSTFLDLSDPPTMLGTIQN